MSATHSAAHKMPFVRIVIPLASGILLYEALPHFLWIVAPFVCALVFFGITHARDFESRFYRKPFFAIALFFFFFGTGTTLTRLQLASDTLALHGKMELRGTVIEPPERKGVYYRFIFAAKEEETPGRIYRKRRKIMVYLRTDDPLTVQPLTPGSGFNLSGRFMPADSLTERDGFNYGLFLKRKGIAGIFFASPRLLTPCDAYSAKTSPTNLLNRWRQTLLQRYRQLNLSDNNYAILTSLTLGNRTAIPDEQVTAYAQSGLTHILAISGMHIVVLYAVLCLFLGIDDRKIERQRIRKIMVIAFLWLFAFLSGFSPSAVRATFMFSLFLAGSLVGRKGNSYNILFAVAALMLLLNPLYLFDVSFQLSFGAVAAILYFDPLLKRLLKTENKLIAYFRDIVTISTAAQIGVLPLLLCYFGTFTLLFPIANLLALPVFPPLLALGWLYLPLSLFGIFDPFFHTTLTFLLNYMNGVAALTAAVPYSHLTTGPLPPWMAAVLYLIVGIGIYFLNRSKRKREE